MNEESELDLKRSTAAVAEGFSSSAIRLLAVMILVRCLPLDDYGEYSSARGTLYIGAVLGTWGMGRLATKVYRGHPLREALEEARGLRRAAPGIVILASLLTVIGVIGLHMVTETSSSIRIVTLVAVMAMLPVHSLLAFFTSSASAHGAGVSANALNSFVYGLTYLATLGVWIWTVGSSLNVLDAASIVAISETLLLVLVFVLLIRVEPKQLRSGPRIFKTTAWMKTGASYATANLGKNISINGGVVILGWVHADAAGAGRLMAALSASSLLLVAAHYASQIYLPVLADAISSRKREAVKNVIRIWLKQVISLLLPLAAALIIAAPEILNFFGSDFREAKWSLILLVSNALFSSVTTLTTPLYQYLENERSAARITSAGAAMGLAGMVVLGSYWSDTGIALATASSMILTGGYIAWLAWRQLREW
ncbi:MAG: hypothetical protein CL917_03650 [Deltaproteobacteria bacterium]|nr:hypothetical protein [Deltaproteobacteria bacterium]